MAFVVIAIVVLLVIALYLWRVVRGQSAPVTTLDELTNRSRTVDVEALHNLIDPAETQFLRQHLPPRQFRTVQRERTMATIEYVRTIAYNAGLLISLGQMGAHNPDPQLAQAAQVMVARALQVRTAAMLALMKLYSRSLVPALPFAVEDIFRDYRNLTDSALLFTRLQRPAFAGRVSATL